MPAVRERILNKQEQKKYRRKGHSKRVAVQRSHHVQVLSIGLQHPQAVLKFFLVVGSISFSILRKGERKGEERVEPPAVQLSWGRPQGAIFLHRSGAEWVISRWQQAVNLHGR